MSEVNERSAHLRNMGLLIDKTIRAAQEGRAAHLPAAQARCPGAALERDAVQKLLLEFPGDSDDRQTDPAEAAAVA